METPKENLNKHQLFGKIEELQRDNRRIAEARDIAEERFRQQDNMHRMTLDYVEGQNKELETALIKLKDSHNALNNSLDELQNILESVENQKSEIEKKNEFITQSIEYAKRIQESILPSKKILDTLLDDYFVFYQPKDIVSGDFYWANETNGKTILIVGDCTGHGVPGAIMATMFNDFINQIVVNDKVTAPNEIVFQLHTRCINFFLRNKAKNIDGADISVCVIDKNQKTVSFAGAMQTLRCVQDNQMKTFKGTSLYLGRNIINIQSANDIQTHIIDISVPTTIYLSSDGYSDQFGGENGNYKKFMSKTFSELLLNIHQKTSLEQYQILEKTITNWKEGVEQTDDMVVVGVKF